MIRSFRGKWARQVHQRERCPGLGLSVQRQAYRKLAILDAADALSDLKIPSGNRLEKLRGNRAGQFSIRVNDQWRICFVWHRGDAYEVEITDYH